MACKYLGPETKSGFSCELTGYHCGIIEVDTCNLHRIAAERDAALEELRALREQVKSRQYFARSIKGNPMCIGCRTERGQPCEEGCWAAAAVKALEGEAKP